jgi:hypothetical protein
MMPGPTAGNEVGGGVVLQAANQMATPKVKTLAFNNVRRITSSP